MQMSSKPQRRNSEPWEDTCPWNSGPSVGKGWNQVIWGLHTSGPPYTTCPGSIRPFQMSNSYIWETKNTNLLFSVFLFLFSVSSLFPLISSPSSLENRFPDFNSAEKMRERNLFPFIKVAYWINPVYRRQQHPGILLSLIPYRKSCGIDSSSFCPAILGILTWDHTSPQLIYQAWQNSQPERQKEKAWITLCSQVI